MQYTSCYTDKILYFVLNIPTIILFIMFFFLIIYIYNLYFLNQKIFVYRLGIILQPLPLLDSELWAFYSRKLDIKFDSILN